MHNSQYNICTFPRVLTYTRVSSISVSQTKLSPGDSCCCIRSHTSEHSSSRFFCRASKSHLTVIGGNLCRLTFNYSLNSLRIITSDILLHSQRFGTVRPFYSHHYMTQWFCLCGWETNNWNNLGRCDSVAPARHRLINKIDLMYVQFCFPKMQVYSRGWWGH